MKRTPIWTAFITNSIASAAWQTKFEAKKVHLQDLTRFVFTDDYVPQLGPREEHELFFARSQGTFLSCCIQTEARTGQTVLGEGRNVRLTE